LTWWREDPDINYSNTGIQLCFAKSEYSCCKYFNSKAFHKSCKDEIQYQISVSDCPEVEAIGRWIKGSIQIEERKIEWLGQEITKLFKNGSHPISFCDVFYKMAVDYRFGSIESTDRIIQNLIIDKKQLDILIGVKPDIESWGSLLRKLKLCIDLTHGDKVGIMVSFDQIAPNIINVLNSEGILYLHVSQK